MSWNGGLGGDSRLRFVDGGTIGFMLSTFIGETPDLLVIDAVRMAEPPAARGASKTTPWTVFSPGDSSSVHEIGLRDALDMARLTGKFPRRRALVGVEPAAVEIGYELSPEVESGVAPASLLARDVLQRWLADGRVAA